MFNKVFGAVVAFVLAFGVATSAEAKISRPRATTTVVPSVTVVQPVCVDVDTAGPYRITVSATTGITYSIDPVQKISNNVRTTNVYADLANGYTFGALKDNWKKVSDTEAVRFVRIIYPSACLAVTEVHGATITQPTCSHPADVTLSPDTDQVSYMNQGDNLPGAKNYVYAYGNNDHYFFSLPNNKWHYVDPNNKAIIYYSFTYNQMPSCSGSHKHKR